MKIRKLVAFTMGLMLLCTAGPAALAEEPYTVAIQVVTLPGTTLEQEAAIEEAINEISIPAINCAVDIQNTWISEVNNRTTMGVAGNEKLDIIHVGSVQPLSSIVGSEVLYDLNQGDLINNYAPAIKALYGDYLKCGEVDGQQLAIPASTWLSKALGFYYNKDMADKYGVEIAEMVTIDDVEKALYAIHEAAPDIYPYYVGTGETMLLQYFSNYEAFGASAAYGVVLDSWTDTTVVNLYETELFKDYCLRMWRWRQDGLLGGDPTDTNTNQAYFTAEKLFLVPCEITPSQKSLLGANSAPINLGWTTSHQQTITNSSVTNYMWGVSINSERPEKAVEFLNLLYSNADVGNLLKYGIEGINYDFIDGSDEIIQTNGTYRVNFYRGGDEHIMYAAMPVEETYVADCVEFDNEAAPSPIVSYMFDDSSFQTEASIITAAINEYLPQLQTGMLESEDEVLKTIEDFNAKLKAGGIDDVIAANQEQLNAYLGK